MYIYIYFGRRRSVLPAGLHARTPARPHARTPAHLHCKGS